MAFARRAARSDYTYGGSSGYPQSEEDTTPRAPDSFRSSRLPADRSSHSLLSPRRLAAIMAPMKTSRLVTVAAVFILAGTHADAQFRRVLPASTTEITLFPVVPPALLLPAGSFD